MVPTLTGTSRGNRVDNLLSSAASMTIVADVTRGNVRMTFRKRPAITANLARRNDGRSDAIYDRNRVSSRGRSAATYAAVSASSTALSRFNVLSIGGNTRTINVGSASFNEENSRGSVVATLATTRVTCGFMPRTIALTELISRPANLPTLVPLPLSLVS